MKATELINVLQQLIDQHGDDLVVCAWGKEGIDPIRNLIIERKDNWSPPGLESYILLEL